MPAPPRYDAYLFDLDGVLTATAGLHAAAWKQTFDDALADSARRTGTAQLPFDIGRDYVAHVDGKPRHDGVRDFLSARGIHASERMVRVIGDRKQALVERALARGEIDAFPGSVRWVEHLRRTGVATAVVSSSTSSRAVLRAAGIDALRRSGRSPRRRGGLAHRRAPLRARAGRSPRVRVRRRQRLPRRAGAPEEGAPARDGGVILNGFHETWPIVYPEDAHGLARTGQTIVGAPDGSIIRLFVDDEPFDLATARNLSFERVLDLRSGVLSRTVEWESAHGVRIGVRSRRLASLDDRHLVAMDYELVALDGPARIALSSGLVTHAPRQETDDPRRGRDSRGRCSSRSRHPRDAAARDGQQRPGAGVRDRAPCRRPPAAGRAGGRRGRSHRPRRGRRPRPGETLRLPPPTTGPSRRPRATCSRAWTPRWIGLRAPASTRLSATTARACRRSGGAATSRSRRRPACSRPCASTSSSSCRPRRAGRGSASPPRA